ncbi:MAG: heme exporter protein CcmD [Cocleimonas sp.]|nr:heme exporter protein CcmD [Cocleimonas sp.]
MSISEFLAMGGYGYYVWGIMLLALVIMVFEPMSLKQQHQRLLQRIKRNNRLQQKGRKR